MTVGQNEVSWVIYEGRRAYSRQRTTMWLHSAFALLLVLLTKTSRGDPADSCNAGVVRVLTVDAGTATEDRTQALSDVEGMLEDAAMQAGCFDLVLLPELFSFLHTREHDTGNDHGAPHSGAEDAEGGETTEACRRWARMWKCYVVCPFAEFGDVSAAGPQQEGRPVYNTAMLIDRKGIEVGRYRKSFPAYGTEFEEGFTPSPPVFSVPVWETDFGRVAVLICFDLHFAELWQELELSGAELVVWPSATGGTKMAQAYATIHHYAVVQQPAGISINAHGDLIPASYTSPDNRVKISQVSLEAPRLAGRSLHPHQEFTRFVVVDETPSEAGPAAMQNGGCEAAMDACWGEMCRQGAARVRDVRKEARNVFGRLRRCMKPTSAGRGTEIPQCTGHHQATEGAWLKGGRELWGSLWQHLEVS